ncbi:MAG: PepSY-like domain-containing protein [bacterium]
MKKLIFVVCILGIALSVNAQKLKESDVPSAVQTSFSSMYPDTKKVKWEMEDGKYEAEFQQNNVETSVLFDANGTYIQKEVEISISELPDAVRNYVSANLSGQKIAEASKISDAGGIITYEAEINNHDYIFDQSGNLLKKESDENEQDKEDDDK